MVKDLMQLLAMAGGDNFGGGGGGGFESVNSGGFNQSMAPPDPAVIARMQEQGFSSGNGMLDMMRKSAMGDRLNRANTIAPGFLSGRRRAPMGFPPQVPPGQGSPGAQQPPVMKMLLQLFGGGGGRPGMMTRQGNNYFK